MEASESLPPPTGTIAIDTEAVAAELARCVEEAARGGDAA